MSGGGAATMTVGLAFYDNAVDLPGAATDMASTRAGSWSFFRALCMCGFGTAKARAAEMYQKHQRYSHCEAYFPFNAFTPFEMQRIRQLPPGSKTPTSDLVVAFAAFDTVPAADISRAKGIVHVPGHPSCLQTDGVIGMSRVFSSAAYKTIAFKVTHEQFCAAKNFALRQLGKPYDRAAASWRIVVFPPTPTVRRWWCASLAHAILKHIGILRWQPLNTLNVGAIIMLASKSDRRDANSARPQQQRFIHTALSELLFAPMYRTGQAYPTIADEILRGATRATEASCALMVPPV